MKGYLHRLPLFNSNEVSLKKGKKYLWITTMERMSLYPYLVEVNARFTKFKYTPLSRKVAGPLYVGFGACSSYVIILYLQLYDDGAE